MSLAIFINLAIGLIGLIIGGEFLVRGATKLAAILGIPAVIIGLTVVAFGTSAPELAVSLQAAFKSNADIAIANVVGSNIFNTLGILGLAALVSPLIIHSQMVKREVPFMIGISILLWGLAYNGALTRIEGILLISILTVYLFWLVREALQKKKENKEIELESESEFKPVPKSFSSLALSTLFLVGGLAIIMVGADKLVIGASDLARSLGVTDAIIGLTIVSIGTSLPEVVASVIATYKGERDIAVGNVIGSNIFNILCILGITSSIQELQISSSIVKVDLPFMIFTAILTLGFFKRGLKLSRKVGAMLILLYCGYTAFLISQV